MPSLSRSVLCEAGVQAGEAFSLEMLEQSTFCNKPPRSRSSVNASCQAGGASADISTMKMRSDIGTRQRLSQKIEGCSNIQDVLQLMGSAMVPLLRGIEVHSVEITPSGDSIHNVAFRAFILLNVGSDEFPEDRCTYLAADTNVHFFRKKMAERMAMALAVHHVWPWALQTYRSSSRAEAFPWLDFDALLERHTCSNTTTLRTPRLPKYALQAIIKHFIEMDEGHRHRGVQVGPTQSIGTGCTTCRCLEVLPDIFGENPHTYCDLAARDDIHTHFSAEKTILPLAKCVRTEEPTAVRVRVQRCGSIKELLEVVCQAMIPDLHDVRLDFHQEQQPQGLRRTVFRACLIADLRDSTGEVNAGTQLADTNVHFFRKKMAERMAMALAVHHVWPWALQTYRSSSRDEAFPWLDFDALLERHTCSNTTTLV